MTFFFWVINHRELMQHVKDIQAGYAISCNNELMDALRTVIQSVLSSDSGAVRKAFVARLLVLPSELEISELYTNNADPDAIREARQSLMHTIALELKSDMETIVNTHQLPTGSFFFFFFFFLKKKGNSLLPYLVSFVLVQCCNLLSIFVVYNPYSLSLMVHR